VGYSVHQLSCVLRKVPKEKGHPDDCHGKDSLPTETRVLPIQIGLLNPVDLENKPIPDTDNSVSCSSLPSFLHKLHLHNSGGNVQTIYALQS
jgi:hypothetical protein